MTRLRIEPQPTREEEQAILAALEVLLGFGPTAKKLRFNDAAFARKGYVDMRRLRINVCGDTHIQDYTWRDVARIEALTPGV